MHFQTPIQSSMPNASSSDYAKPTRPLLSFLQSLASMLDTHFNDKALKCHLRCALSKKLSRQLVNISLKDFSYQQLVQKCQTQNNQLRAASLNVCKTSPRFQLSVKPAKTSSPAINLPAPSKPTTLDANVIDPTHSKLTPQEKKRRCTLGLCFYCGLESLTTFTCPLKPTKAHVRTIQKAPAT